MAGTTDPLKTAFDEAWTAFEANTAYWILGNGYDTILDYLDIVSGPAGADAKYAQGALRKFGSNVNFLPTAMKGEAWYDDDGWWILASLKAFTLSAKLRWPAYVAIFANFALAKWARFNAFPYADGTLPATPGAPNVYEKSPSHPGIENLFDGGVWNSPWDSAPVDAYADPAGCVPYGDMASPLCGYQNTVTNALYLVSAERLRNAAQADPDIFNAGATYAACAEREYRFFQAWFDPAAQKKGAGVAPILNRLNGGTTGPLVIRERVTAYADKSAPNGYEADQAWSGDQGIFLGALVERLKRATGGEHDTLLGLAKDLIRGVGQRLTDGKGMLLSWPQDMGPPGGASDAYSTGMGVFLRYFVHAIRSNGDIDKFCASPESAPSPDWKSFSDFVAKMVSVFETGPRAYESQMVGAAELTKKTNALALRLAAHVVEHRLGAASRG